MLHCPMDGPHALAVPHSPTEAWPPAPSLRAPHSAPSSFPRRRAARAAADSSLQEDALSSDEDLDGAYGPSSIASLLNEANLQTSSC